MVSVSPYESKQTDHKLQAGTWAWIIVRLKSCLLLLHFRISYNRSGARDPNDPNTWNTMTTDDMSNPKVFLCKAGMFLEKVTEKMDGERVMIKERFGPEEFQDTCDKKHLNPVDAGPAVAAASTVDVDDGGILASDVEIIDVERKSNDSTKAIFGDNHNIRDLPILVFEGMKKKLIFLKVFQYVVSTICSTSSSTLVLQKTMKRYLDVFLSKYFNKRKQ